MKTNQAFFLVLAVLVSPVVKADGWIETVKLSDARSKELVKNMAVQEVARLALTGKLGACKATYLGPQASYLFEYKTNSGTSHLGETRSQNSWPSLNPPSTSGRLFTTTFPTAPALTTSTSGNMILYTTVGYDSTALKTLGTTLQAKVASGDCGALSFETQEVSFKKAGESDIQFYRKSEGSPVICGTSSIPRTVNVNCEIKTIPTYFPEKVCKFLYQMARTKGASRTAQSEVVPTELAEFKPEVEQLYRMGSAISDDNSNKTVGLDFDLARSVRKPTASDYLPYDILTLLSGGTNGLDRFTELDRANKIKLVNLVLTYHASKGSDYVPWSQDLKAIAELLTKDAELFVRMNPTEPGLKIYGMPTLKQYEDAMAGQFSSLKSQETSVSSNFSIAKCGNQSTSVEIEKWATALSALSHTSVLNPSDSLLSSLGSTNDISYKDYLVSHPNLFSVSNAQSYTGMPLSTITANASTYLKDSASVAVSNNGSSLNNSTVNLTTQTTITSGAAANFTRFNDLSNLQNVGGVVIQKAP